jgi:hypothetical protein
MLLLRRAAATDMVINSDNECNSPKKSMGSFLLNGRVGAASGRSTFRVRMFESSHSIRAGMHWRKEVAAVCERYPYSRHPGGIFRSYDGEIVAFRPFMSSEFGRGVNYTRSA